MQRWRIFSCPQISLFNCLILPILCFLSFAHLRIVRSLFQQKHWDNKMKRILGLTLLILGAEEYAVAEEKKGTYASFQAGVALGVDYDASGTVLESVDTRQGPAFSFLLGRDYGNWRSDLELSYTNQSIDSINGLNQRFNASGDIESYSFLSNAYYAPQYGNWEPYIGGGLGFTHYDAEIKSLGAEDSGSDTVFTWQGKVGLAYHLNESWAVDANYAYQDGSDISIGNSNFDQQQSIVRIGLRAYF